MHLGADVPAARPTPPRTPTLVTVAHLAARKRHADVISALAVLRVRHPALRYVIVGDGPERERLESLAGSLGVADRVEFRGQLPNDGATAEATAGSLFVMPSVDEAFGVAYIEAMAGGVPAIGCRGEDGPEEIAAAGGGIELVAPLYVRGLAKRIDGLLSDPPALAALGDAARETVQRAFTWERCGVDTVAAYEEALERVMTGSEPYSSRQPSRPGQPRLDARGPLPPDDGSRARADRAAGGDPGAGGLGRRRLAPRTAPVPEPAMAPCRGRRRSRQGRRRDRRRPRRRGACWATPGGWTTFPADRFRRCSTGWCCITSRSRARWVRVSPRRRGCSRPEARWWRSSRACGIRSAPACRSPTARGSPRRCTARATTFRYPATAASAEARAVGLRPELHAVTYTWRRLPPAVQRSLQPLDALGPGHAPRGSGIP